MYVLNSPLKHLFDIRYFLTLSKDVCSERRDARDYLPPDPPGYFDQIVWPMYLHNLNDVKSIYSIGQGNQQESITFLEGTLDPDFIFEKVVGDIKTLMSS
jgi:nicotinamide/nicotinate riboside kinase